MTHVGIDGTAADAELVGNLLVGPSLGQQAQDLHLPFRHAPGWRARESRRSDRYDHLQPDRDQVVHAEASACFADLLKLLWPDVDECLAGDGIVLSLQLWATRGTQHLAEPVTASKEGGRVPGVPGFVLDHRVGLDPLKELPEITVIGGEKEAFAIEAGGFIGVASGVGDAREQQQ